MSDLPDSPEMKLTPHERQTLKERHHAAMQVLPDCTTEYERWDLLLAVVWPEDDKLRTFEDAA